MHNAGDRGLKIYYDEILSWRFHWHSNYVFELKAIYNVYSKPINFHQFYGYILHSILFL